MYAKKNSNMKIIAAIVAVVLLLGCGIGGTLAWLMDRTDPVTNTFTAGKVDITLKESPYDPETGVYSNPAEGTANQYPAIPGASYKKDPVVAVETGSEDCYLFVKFEYSEKANTYLNYTSNLTEADGWTKISTGTGSPEVWYRVVNKTDSTRSFALLEDLGAAAGITLEIDPDAVTSQTMDEASAQSLKWTAYAVQFNYLKDAAGNAISGDTPEAAAKAWDVLNP